MHFLRVRNLGAATQLRGPRTPMRLPSDCQWRLQSSQSSLPPYSHCFQQEASFPHYMGLQGCCQLASPKTNDPQARVCPVCKLYNLISDVTDGHFCYFTVHTDQSWYSMGGTIQRPLGAIVEAGYHIYHKQKPKSFAKNGFLTTKINTMQTK